VADAPEHLIGRLLDAQAQAKLIGRAPAFVNTLEKMMGRRLVAAVAGVEG